MILLLTLLHVTVCFFLILVVLLQTGKGADIAAAFGGVSQTAFGARGGATLLSKLTTGSAIIFMLTSLILAIISTGPGTSVIDQATPAAPAGQVPGPGAPSAPAPVAAPVVPGASDQAAPGQETPSAPESPAGTPGETPSSGSGGF